MVVTLRPQGVVILEGFFFIFYFHIFDNILLLTLIIELDLDLILHG